MNRGTPHAEAIMPLLALESFCKFASGGLQINNNSQSHTGLDFADLSIIVKTAVDR